MPITDTASFLQAVLNGQLAKAEAWLNQQKASPAKPGYDQRWVDHRERELFRAYYSRADWPSAKHIVEGSALPSSKEGRGERLQNLSGLKYEDI